MGWLNAFATVAYAGWTAAVLATIGVILAEYRSSRDPLWLLVLATALLQFVGSATLGITIGSWQFVPWLLGAIIVRVAWLFGPGGVNFPTKIVAAADKHGSLRVVDDEFGNPTYAPDAARAIAALIATDRDGAYHLVNAGYTSRYELAATVLHHAGRGDVPLTPIHADDWPRPSQPPRHAVLANQTAAALGIELRPWQEAAAEFAATLAPAPQDQAAG